MTPNQVRRPAGTGPRGAVLTALLLAVCGGDPDPVAVTSHEIESPAGPASGEPFLSSSGDEVYLSWLERNPEGGHDLRFARHDGGVWEEPRVIASGEDFLVNWADFPSVTVDAAGTLWAHWLRRGESGGYDYGIRVAHSVDGGASWSEPWTPHEDGTPTEHGFVATTPVSGGMGFLWLDGRRFVHGDHGLATREMALMFRSADGHGVRGPETVVDARVCDCCQTDAAVAASGPVAVYRDRSPEEIRDIYITRWVDGAWSEGVAVHDDGWETGACPVNGPAVAARDDVVVVAWYTAADDRNVVKLARSEDGGVSFRPPVVIDDAGPAGRVDVALLEDGSSLVSWLARAGGVTAEVRVVRVDHRGRPGPAVSVSRSSSERASGFPRMTRSADGTILLAWTDVAETDPRVRVARIETEGT